VNDALRQLARRARVKLVAGELRGPALDELLRSVPFLERDPFVDELLEIGPPPPDLALPAGAVPYLPCGVDEILAFVRDAGISAADSLVVLGSGLGRVAFLVSLLTSAPAHGIEIQAHLVDRARAIQAELRIPVTFEHASITDVELDASAVFLYAPCNGGMLARVIERITALASRRKITVGAVGVELEVPSLVPRASSNRALALYTSR
jgi:hypothetical protein